MPIFSQYEGENAHVIFNILKTNVERDVENDFLPNADADVYQQIDIGFFSCSRPVMSRQITAHSLGPKAANDCNTIIAVLTKTIDDAHDVENAKKKTLYKVLAKADFNIKNKSPDSVVTSIMKALIKEEKHYDNNNEPQFLFQP